ncbi:hypothetical protein [Azospirillum doebereinerae]
MNAETGSEPESPKKRGRIPQSAWPQILERYHGGVTLSAIAREFECTPSAISYIIKKAEAASSQGELGVGTDAGDTTTAQPGTVDAAAADAAPAPAPVEEAPVVETVAAPVAETPAAEPRRDTRPARAAAPRGTLTRTRPVEPVAEAPPAEAAPAAPAAPAPTETLRLSRPEPAPQPASQPAPQPVAAAPANPSTPADAAPRTTAGQPTPPVDAVEGRLRDTAKACITAYRGWRQQPSEGTIQSLSDTVHELRKALARIEIDMSASRREEQAIRPIPIPAHRASRRPQ